jgi:hypothetical protein
MASRQETSRVGITQRCAIFIAGIFVAVSLPGCSAQTPATPSPAGASPPRESPVRTVYGVVIDGRGACIAGAMVEVIAGQAIGLKSAQSGPCDAWWPFNGFQFRNLIPGLSLRLRATAPGHLPKEMTVMPDLQAVEFLLDPLPGSKH